MSVASALPAAEDGDLANEMVELDEGAVDSLRIAQHIALLVALPAKNGPAEKAGLKPGDVIFALNGQPTPNLVEFTAAVRRTGSGGEVRLGVWRRGEKITLPVRLGGSSGATSSANTKQEIEAYKVIGKTFEKRQFPAIWGFIHLALGDLYLIRAEGRTEDNLETAIAEYGSALTVFTREAFPQQWARTENHLALAYIDRVRGSRAENLEVAIRASKAALEVLTRGKFPREWVQIQHCLGLAYMDRIQGNREDNVDAAIEAYKTALTILTEESYPQDWARMQRNLGEAYRARLRGEKVDNLKEATKADEAALTVLSPTTSSALPAATNPAPQEAPASHETQLAEQGAKAAQPAVAPQPRPPVESGEKGGGEAQRSATPSGGELATGPNKKSPEAAWRIRWRGNKPERRRRRVRSRDGGDVRRSQGDSYNWQPFF